VEVEIARRIGFHLKESSLTELFVVERRSSCDEQVDLDGARLMDDVDA
jgi:hypothetical protein